MGKYTVTEVQTKKDLKKFIKFPDALYKGCPQYVPALHGDQFHSLTDVASAKYCPHKMWLVWEGKRVVGRICGMVNPRYNEFYKTKRARFGWFDTINDIEVARLLISTAEAWAKAQGMNEIHGPLFYNTLGKQGMLVEGYENIPPFNCYYNYPYYNDLVTELGFVKELDWIQYRMPASQPVPDKVTAISDKMFNYFKLKEAPVDVLKKDKTMVEAFFKSYNEGFAGEVKNFVPLTEEEMEEEASQVINTIDDRLSSIVMDEDGEVAAFGLALPSISKALQKAKGKLFPFGWIHILRAMKNVETLDLVLIGASPKWQNTGVSAVFYDRMGRKFREQGARWAIANPQIEDNPAVYTWEKFEHELYMRRRCYIKAID